MDIKTLLQNNKAYKISGGSDMQEFEGTFDEIIMLNNEGLIKPVFDENNKMVGLSYEDEDLKNDPTKEAQVQYNFYKAYMCKPVDKWVDTLHSIMQLKNYLYNNYDYSEEELDTVDDLLNDIIEDLSNKEYHKTHVWTPEPKETQTPASLLKDNYMFEAEETITDYDELSNEELLKEMKKYLSVTYGYCLARNNNMKVSISTNDQGVDYIKVEDVSWGRKLTQSELEKREASFYKI